MQRHDHLSKNPLTEFTGVCKKRPREVLRSIGRKPLDAGVLGLFGPISVDLHHFRNIHSRRFEAGSRSMFLRTSDPAIRNAERIYPIFVEVYSTGGQWVCTFNGYEDLGPRMDPRTGSRTDPIIRVQNGPQNRVQNRPGPRTGSRMDKLTFRAGFSFVHFRPVLEPEIAGKLQSVQRKKLIFSAF